MVSDTYLLHFYIDLILAQIKILKHFRYFQSGMMQNETARDQKRKPGLLIFAKAQCVSAG